MYKRLVVSALSLGLAMVIGCSNGGSMSVNSEPATPAAENDQAGEERAKSAAVSETDLVAQLQQVRADYKRLLQVMHRWYLDQGLHDKATWAKNELSDLNRVRTREYLSAGEAQALKLKGVDESGKASLQSIDMSTFPEADRVEQLYEIRANYKLILKSLIDCFCDSGQSRKADWARTELLDLKQVRQYPYLVEVDIQDTNQCPKDSIVEADKIYAEARRLHTDSKFLPFINNKRGLKDALDKYVLLIKCYPTSDKIDDAAYYAGEISKEYFNDDVQAVRYYEMAMKWNPRTPHPVRFQCAVIYDYRLHDRARAMAMYQRVLKEESEIDQTNTNFAGVRLRQLLKEEEKAEYGAAPEIREAETTPGPETSSE